jgi:UDP-N-acetylglucosamine--N-acetylmuramyl-(pentapeptide) pyrophosphoryl-undecaprenol N-acetylglucosamine transferase
MQKGAAIILEDDKLSDQLVSTVSALLDNPQKLDSMRVAMQELSRPQAASHIADELFALCQERS